MVGRSYPSTSFKGTDISPSGDRLPFLRREHFVFLAVAYGFSWAMWVSAWFLARRSGGELVFNEELVWTAIFEEGSLGPLLGVSGLALLAVYGPLLAGFLASALDPTTSRQDLYRRMRIVRVGSAWYLRALFILIAVTAVPALVLAAFTGLASDAPSLPRLGGFLVVFFVFQLFTSGLEEPGWRGYLLDRLLPGRSLWDAGWAVGVPWALWHLPVVLILFAQQGMEPILMLTSFVGFGIGIVAMSILHTWFYANTKSVFLAIVIHAAFNTVPLAAGFMLASGSYFTAVASQLSLWAVVIFITKRAERAEAATVLSP